MRDIEDLLRRSFVRHQSRRMVRGVERRILGPIIGCSFLILFFGCGLIYSVILGILESLGLEALSPIVSCVGCVGCIAVVVVVVMLRGVLMEVLYEGVFRRFFG